MIRQISTISYVSDRSKDCTKYLYCAKVIEKVQLVFGMFFAIFASIHRY